MISLVVGGKTGIGRSIVEVLRGRGDQVITFSRRKIKDENQSEKISSALINWLSLIDDGKKDLDSEQIIQELIKEDIK